MSPSSCRFARTIVAPLVAACCAFVCSRSVLAQAASPTAAAATEGQLFVVEIKVGPKWDPSKAPAEQLHFKEHSANLRRLRETGNLVLGARYSDKGLVVLSAVSEVEARAMLDADLSFNAGVFVYELHKFNVFYSGNVQGRTKMPSSQ